MFVGRTGAKITAYSQFFCEGIAEEEIADDDPELLAFINPPPPPYTIGADVPWSRMVSDEEAEAVQDAIDAQPVKTRNMINKATSFTEGADAFTKFKGIIVAALDAARADAIMGPLLPSELAATIGDEAA